MGLEAFKNQFNLDGKLKPQPGVTREKVKAVKDLFEKAQSGSYTAEAQLKELFTTSDASFSMAHLLNIQTIPNLPRELEEMDGLMGKRTVRDFNPVVLRQLLPVDGKADVEGAGIGEHGEASVVPEGTPYPLVTFQGDETAYSQKLAKRGFRFDFTFESWINDLVGELEGMPERMLSVTKNTILADYWEGLNLVDNPVASVDLPDGRSTQANPRLSALGIIAAVTDIENREINGRKIGSVGSYIVLVPRGAKRFLEYDIAQFGRIREVHETSGTETSGTINSTTIVLAPDAKIQALFPAIRIVESDRLTGTAWKIYPTPGSTPLPVIERLVLRGYENPEIRVRNDTGGFYPGGGKIGPFEGSYDADGASFRFRLITGAAVWFDQYIANSTGVNDIFA